MIDVLTALSLYRQLEALDTRLIAVGGRSVIDQFLTAYHNQGDFNHILSEVRSRCTDAPDYLATIGHIQPADIPPGADRSAYPRFLANVQGLRQAVGALLELTATPEQKQAIGFRQ